MVKIRLARHGSKKHPFYRIVVADSEFSRNGRYIEQLGTYDPSTDPATVKFESEKVNAWLAKGAQPTNTVSHLIRQAQTAEAPTT